MYHNNIMTSISTVYVLILEQNKLYTKCENDKPKHFFLNGQLIIKTVTQIDIFYKQYSRWTNFRNFN